MDWRIAKQKRLKESGRGLRPAVETNWMTMIMISCQHVSLFSRVDGIGVNWDSNAERSFAGCQGTHLQRELK